MRFYENQVCMIKERNNKKLRPNLRNILENTLSMRHIHHSTIVWLYLVITGFFMMLCLVGSLSNNPC